MRVRLATRVGFSYGVMVIAMLIVLIAAWWAFETARQQASHVRQQLMPSIEAANHLLLTLEEMENTEFLYFTAKPDMERWMSRYDSLVPQFQKWQVMAEESAHSREEREAIVELGTRFGELVQIDRTMRLMIGKGQVPEANQMNVTSSMEVAEGVRQEARRYRAVNLLSIERSQEAEARVLSVAEGISMAVALSGIGIALMLWIREARLLIQPVHSLQAAFADLARGSFREASDPATKQTLELETLQQDFNRMGRRIQEMTSSLQAAKTHLEERVRSRTAELQTANQRLESLVSELRGLDKLKSDLMSVVSHELLTPINFIQAYGSTLAEGLMGPLSPEQQDAVEKMLEGARRLTRMVRNMLEYAQIQSGSLVIRQEAMEYGALVEDVVESARSDAESKSQSLELVLTGRPVMVWADPGRAAQVLLELLDNAIKFTPERGKIHVELKTEPGHVVTVVTDSGVGISPEEAAKLFSGFHQVDLSSTRSYGGVGLGLAIVHYLVTAMGGSISIDSALGQGSTFKFTLPLFIPPEE